MLISKESINGNTRKRRDIDNKLGIFNAKFLSFFRNNKLVFVYKKYITLSTSLNFSKHFKWFLMLDSIVCFKSES